MKYLTNTGWPAEATTASISAFQRSEYIDRQIWVTAHNTTMPKGFFCSSGKRRKKITISVILNTLAGEYGSQQTKGQRQGKLDKIVIYHFYTNSIAATCFSHNKLTRQMFYRWFQDSILLPRPVVPRIDPLLIHA